jgi:GT2 family glycosyltransferase
MKAVREHLERLGIAASVTEAGPSLAAVNRTLKQRPLVSLVTAIDGAKSRSYGVDSLLGEQLIASITGNTKYRNYELVMVVPSNLPESQQQELLIQAQGRGRFVNVAPGTALAAALNVGLLSTSSEFVGMIDQRCEMTDESWLEILMSYIIAKDVALAAPTLTDSFGLVFSAGLGLTPEPHHVGAGRLISDLGAVGMFGIARESLGVSTACVVARAATLQAVGGFSQEFVGRMFDFDLACKLYQEDKRCIITPRTSVRIHGSEQVTPADLEVFRSRWGRFIANDPYTRIDTRLQLALAAHSVS